MQRVKRFLIGKRNGNCQRVASYVRQRAFVAPLATLSARLEHGQLGVWDEVAVGGLLVGCAVAYAVWFFVSSRNEGPRDSE